MNNYEQQQYNNFIQWILDQWTLDTKEAQDKALALLQDLEAMKQLLNKFNQEYELLYQNDDKIAGYSEAVNAFENDLNNENFKQLVQKFAQYRQDFISSDREAAAFEFALESLGLFDKLGI